MLRDLPSVHVVVSYLLILQVSLGVGCYSQVQMDFLFLNWSESNIFTYRLSNLTRHFAGSERFVFA